MNLQILSNTINSGKTNYTNDFEMRLIQPIDALNREAFFELLSITYPATTKNINDDKCWSFFLHTLRDFKTDGNYTVVKSDNFIVPEGVYTLDKLLCFLNNASR